MSLAEQNPLRSQKGQITKQDFFAHAHEIMAERLGNPVPAKA
jgi:hypothetical protein